MTLVDHPMVEALEWVRRTTDPTFDDWDAHSAWLEADPRHLDAFDRAVLLLDDMTATLEGAAPNDSKPASVNDNHGEAVAGAPSGRWGRWSVGLGTAAAAVIAGIGLPLLQQGGAGAQMIATGPGQSRSVTLGDGTRIALNGDTAVHLDRTDPRIATVMKGEAFFSVVHNTAHPFTVRAGDATFQDVGTSFDVIRTATTTQVAVREGAIVYDPTGAAVRLDGGQAVRIADSRAVVEPIDAVSVGGWRSGRLTYHKTPLAIVAADIARKTGQSVTVEEGIASRPFSGVIMIDADQALMFRRLATVTGIAVRRDGASWRLVSPTP